jgi:enoyl-CoA hydratase/carnithine racemase
MSDGFKSVTFEVRPDGIATMTLNRPKVLNCFDEAMMREWCDVVAQVAYDDAIRVLVITGAGRAFSTGVDLNVLKGERSTASFRYYYRQNHRGFDDLEALEKPVIAAVNGLCYGGGLELALSCDIRIAAQDATFCLIENQLGVIPASGACNRLAHYIGLGKTKEMILTAEPIDAAEAHRTGLVNQVVPAAELLPKAYTFAEKLLSRAPQAMGMGKHVVNLCLNTDLHTGRYLERLGQSVLITTEDAQEGLAATSAKRRPHFTGK